MSIYEKYNGIIIILAILFPITVALIHYLKIGAKGVSLSESNNEIQRFTRFERNLHLLRTVTFIIVAISGIIFVFIDVKRAAELLHSISGKLFMVVTLITLFLWFKESAFKAYDKIWLKNGGGYFSKKSKELPAGKFNAGQKIFFWLTILLTIILTATGINLSLQRKADGINEMLLAVHGISAAIAITAVIGHIYLSVWANKGTWRILTKGKVSKEWARYHHSEWKK